MMILNLNVVWIQNKFYRVSIYAVFNLARDPKLFVTTGSGWYFLQRFSTFTLKATIVPHSREGHKKDQD